MDKKEESFQTNKLYDLIIVVTILGVKKHGFVTMGNDLELELLGNLLNMVPFRVETLTHVHFFMQGKRMGNGWQIHMWMVKFSSSLPSGIYHGCMVNLPCSMDL
jgi:hypothetical protein